MVDCRFTPLNIILNVFLLIGAILTCVALFAPAWRTYPNEAGDGNIGEGVVLIHDKKADTYNEKSLTGDTEDWNQAMVGLYVFSLVLTVLAMMLTCVVACGAVAEKRSYVYMFVVLMVLFNFGLELAALTLYVGRWNDPPMGVTSTKMLEKYVKGGKAKFDYAMYCAASALFMYLFAVIVSVLLIARSAAITGISPTHDDEDNDETARERRRRHRFHGRRGRSG